MADLQEIGALLHIHKALQEHGDMFPHMKREVLEALRRIEADHAPKKEHKQAIVPIHAPDDSAPDLAPEEIHEEAPEEAPEEVDASEDTSTARRF